MFIKLFINVYCFYLQIVYFYVSFYIFFNLITSKPFIEMTSTELFKNISKPSSVSISESSSKKELNMFIIKKVVL